MTSILINFGCCQKITAEDNETFYAEVNKPPENLTAIGYEIVNFNETNTEVRNTLERLKDFLLYFFIKVILNSTEWEITVHMQEFDEFWMRYASGRGSSILVLNLQFSISHPFW